jgi:hypothetical protein
VGIPQRSEDRLLSSRQADRQRLLRIVQRDLPSRMSGHQLVPNSTRNKAHHRAMEAGIYCESSSQALADRTPAEFASQIELKRDLAETKTGRELTSNWYRKSRPFVAPVCLISLVQKSPGISLKLWAVLLNRRAGDVVNVRQSCHRIDSSSVGVAVWL